MSSDLHIPLNFERTEHFRLFVRRLRAVLANSQTISLEDTRAEIFAFRLWMEWANAGIEWRRLRHSFTSNEQYNWLEDDLTLLIEESCQWHGKTGQLVSLAIDTKFVQVESREDTGKQTAGLILTDFWKSNKHLDPNFKSIQQKGGAARAKKLQDAQVIEQAGKRRKIAEQQGRLPFTSEVPQDEQEKSYALVMRIDRAFGKPPRNQVDFTPQLMDNALKAVRSSTDEDIASVELFLVDHREDSNVVKLAERILLKWPEILAQAHEHQLRTSSQ